MGRGYKKIDTSRGYNHMDTGRRYRIWREEGGDTEYGERKEGIQSYGYREELQNMDTGRRYRIWREEGGDTIIWIQGGDTIIWIQGGDTEYGERKEGIQEYGYNEVGPRKYKGDVKIKISKKK